MNTNMMQNPQNDQNAGAVKILCLLLILSACLSARATTVTGAVYQITGNALGARIIISPTNMVSVGGSGLVAGPALSFSCSNNFSTNLLTGYYSVTIPPKQPFTIQVTNDSAAFVENITNLIQTGALFQVATNPSFSVVAGLTPGTNITFQTNGSGITINGTGGGSGATLTNAPDLPAGVISGAAIGTNIVLPDYVMTNGYDGTPFFLNAQLNLDPLTGATFGSGDGILGSDGSVTATVIQGAATNAISSKLSTNTIGATVNAITYGLIPDSATDNTVALSNLMKSVRTIRIPSGTFILAGPVISTNPVNIVGDGFGSVLKYTGDSNYFALTLAAGSTVKGMSFQGLASGTPVETAGGAVKFDATGFPFVKDCLFQNWNGTLVYAEGTGDLYTRSNNWTVSGNSFSNYFHGVVGSPNDTSEGGKITDNNGTLTFGSAVWIKSPNCNIQGNNFNGYVGEFGVPSPTSYGIRLVVSNTVNTLKRGHPVISGNIFRHFKYDVWVEGIHGYQDSGVAPISGNFFGGGQFTMLTNNIGLMLGANHFGPYDTAFFSSLTNWSMNGVNISTPTIVGLQGFVGGGNWTNGVQLPFQGNGSGLTNLNAGSLTGIIPSNSFVNIIATNVNAATLNTGPATNTTLKIVTSMNVGSAQITGANNVWNDSYGIHVNEGGSQGATAAYGFGSDYPSKRGMQENGIGNLVFRTNGTFLGPLTANGGYIFPYLQPTTNGLTSQGGIVGCNGTNYWSVLRDSGGVLTTNKFTLTTWP